MAHTTTLSPAEAAEGLGDAGWVFVDCRFELADPEAGRRQFAESHLPGAVYAHLDEDLSSPVTPDSGRHPLPDADRLARTLGAWGIGPGVQVVAYDGGPGAFAARLWWLLRWLGRQEAAVLDGGFAAWQAAGLPTTDQAPAPTPASFAAGPDDSLWVTTKGLEAALASGETVLLDARGAERFRGEVEPVDPVAGHVPGAVNVPHAGNVGPSGSLLTTQQLHDRFAPFAQQAGAAGVVHMCGSGVTACHNALAMAAAGLPMGRLYAGSWSEWIRDPDRPIATGE